MNFEGVLISGSLSGVYDEEPWIKRLLKEINFLDKQKIKTCGISFGHQAIAKALGGTVKRNPKGSEVSVRSAVLTCKGKELLGTSRREFKLHYHHNDAIIDLPPDLWVLAYNNVTKYQALYKHPHLLTFCGHPDYSHEPKVLEHLLQYDRKHLLLHEQLIEHGLENLYAKTDYEWIVKQIMLFFQGVLETRSTKMKI
ncbi:hypothetical protein O6H91_14G083700 [Diphasiastrum complanatum]|nr:hypothetical protein O6H91_14G083700 [Diphasiastrum complanatum]